MEVPDYGIAVEDEDIPDYGLDEGIQPEKNKQLVLKPSIYEQSSEDLLEGKKQIYVNPQYFPQELQEFPPEYDKDEIPNYALKEQDNFNYVLDDLGLTNYDSIEKQLDEIKNQKRILKKYILTKG